MDPELERLAERAGCTLCKFADGTAMAVLGGRQLWLVWRDPERMTFNKKTTEEFAAWLSQVKDQSPPVS